MTLKPLAAPLRLLPALAAAAALLAGGSALAQSAQRFVFMADAQSGTGFIDPASIRTKGAYKTAELLMVMKPDGSTPGLAYGIVTMEFDCSGKRSHIIKAGAYGPDGSYIGGGESPDEPFNADDLNEPDTVAVYGVVCQGKAPVGPFSGAAQEAYNWAKARF